MLGQCFGVVVRSRGIGGNFMAGLRSIVGGEIHEYTQMLEEARRHALDRMVQNATAMGANAIVMMRFDSSEIGQTMSEIVAYGTAGVIEPAGLGDGGSQRPAGWLGGREDDGLRRSLRRRTEAVVETRLRRSLRREAEAMVW